MTTSSWLPTAHWVWRRTALCVRSARLASMKRLRARSTRMLSARHVRSALLASTLQSGARAIRAPSARIAQIRTVPTARALGMPVWNVQLDLSSQTARVYRHVQLVLTTPPLRGVNSACRVTQAVRLAQVVNRPSAQLVHQVVQSCCSKVNAWTL